MMLTGRVALVTGGGRGIGAAIGAALARAGAKVVLTARTQSEIDQIAAAIGAAGGIAHATVCDVTQEASVLTLAETTERYVGPVEILVNAAGAGTSTPLAKLTLADWESMLAQNATSVFLCTRAFVPGMMARGFGRVVTVASIAGLEGARYIAAYAAAKHAAIGFTRAVAAEVAGSGVTVNAVCPRYVDTPMTERTIDNVVARTGMSRQEALERILATSGQKRLTTPDEVAAAVVGLLVDESANGRALVVNEGMPT